MGLEDLLPKMSKAKARKYRIDAMAAAMEDHIESGSLSTYISAMLMRSSSTNSDNKEIYAALRKVGEDDKKWKTHFDNFKFGKRRSRKKNKN